MSLKYRLLAYINSLLLFAVLIGISLIIASAHTNVRQEILSTQSLAVFAIENAIEKNPEIFLLRNQKRMGLANLNELRHLNIQLFDTNNMLIDRTSSDLAVLITPPKWFVNIMEDFSTTLPTKKISINLEGKDFGYILINPEPMYEYSEIWQQIQNGFFVILLFFGFVNSMILIVFYQTLKPINSIIKGFKHLENEDYTVRISKSNILELDIIGQNFNKMVKNLKESNIKVHKLSQNLINVQEQEKKELARNLHDELGQSLTAIQAEAASIKKNNSEKSRIQALNSIIYISKNMMFSTRELIKKLSLGILDDMGFEIAISDLISDWSKRYPKILLNYSFDKNLLGLIPGKYEGHIYRIIQEALTNIAKHSKSKNITISLQLKKNINTFEIKIINDGVKKKFNNKVGLGLLGMKERVNQMKGKISFTTNQFFEINIILRLGK
jgi:two-component system sensor histidine kinase UhpB